MTRSTRLRKLAPSLLAAVAMAVIAMPEAADASSIVVQPHLAGGRGRTPNNETEYKVRDSDGNLVARGWISHENGENTATVEGLPEGDYTVETYTDRDDGTRLGGKAKVKLDDGEQQGQQVEMDPLTPEEDLQEQVDALEDRIAEGKTQITHIEEDIAEHERRGEDDAVDLHEDEIDRIKDRIKAWKKRLRKKKAELDRLRRAGKKAAGKAGLPPVKRPDSTLGNMPNLPSIPDVPHVPGGAGPKAPKGYSKGKH